MANPKDLWNRVPVRGKWAGAIAGLAVIVALVYWLRPEAKKPLPLDEIDEDFERVLAVENPGYVGIEVCAECHDERASVVKGTRHYQACRPAPEGIRSPGFEPGKGRIPSSDPAIRFEMTRRENEFSFARIQKTSTGEERISTPIAFVYGSGAKYDEMYFTWRENRLFSLPVAWLAPRQQWGIHELHVNRIGETAPFCLECHNTWISHVPGTVNEYRPDDMLLGVTCERCHGPGREHVQYHRTHPGNHIAQNILYPGSLDRERLMDICGQCHVNHRLLGAAFSYRPGLPFESFAYIEKPPHPENDSTNQVHYLRESKCFQKSEMTCITCHDPHRLNSGKNACAKCHPPGSCQEQPRLPVAIRGDCTGCHMPRRIRTHFHLYDTGDDRYVPLAIRADHRIGIYPEAGQAVLLAWFSTQADAASRAEADRLKTQLVQFWLREADERRDAGRLYGEIGALREAFRIGPEPVIRHRLDNVASRLTKFDETLEQAASQEKIEEAISLMNRALELKPNSEQVHARLGNALASIGRRREAAEHFHRVVKCDPNDPSGALGLAWMAYSESNYDEAIAWSTIARSINPADPRDHEAAAQALIKLERWPEAEREFRKLLLSSPTHSVGNQGLSESLRRQGNILEAIRFGRRSLHWTETPRAEQFLTLADAYIAANRTHEAREQLQRAIGLAMQTNQSLVQPIRERLSGLE
jgi:tetratricopeptide (TPR) repeat protein